MEKCGAKCEVYSRVTGYFRPVANWNRGKQEEFRERKTFKVAAAAHALLLTVCCLLLAGCGTTQTLAEGIAEKSISGAGTVAIQRVGIDPDTKTPVLKSTVITGDYASARHGDYALQYRRKKSPSIWNTDAVTEEITINYIGTREQAETALDLAKQDVTGAGAQPGLAKPDAATPAAGEPAATAAEKGTAASDNAGGAK